MKSFSLILFVNIILLISACGKKGRAEKIKHEQLTFDPEGIYSAILIPVNQKDHSNFKSRVTISKWGDNFNVKIKFNNGPSGKHHQGLYSDEVCPKNGIENTMGELLIPFDGELSTRLLGEDDFPNGEHYLYERSTSYSLMISDLQQRMGDLQLSGKAVAIHADIEGNTGKKFLIACGILRQVYYEPQDDTPEGPRILIRPRSPTSPQVRPCPNPEVERSRTIWQRVRNRLGRWWYRLWRNDRNI